MSHREELPDGSVLHVEPTGPGVPLVSLTISFRSGASADPEGREGAMRLMLRSMRRGTSTLSAAAVDDRIDQLGAEVAVEIAPSSSTLHAQVVSRNLDPFVELLAEILADPAFDVDELERLRRETEAELVEARDSDRGLCSTWFRRTLFAGHPYARSALGRASTLSAIDREQVITMHGEVVRRGNAVIGLSGDVSLERARAVHERLLARLPQGAPARPPLGEPARPKGRRLVFVDKPERTQTQLQLGTLGTHPADPDHVALALANTAFGGTFTARLMQEVRAKRGWSYGASSRLSIERRRHAFSLVTAPGAEQVADCLELELTLWQAWYERGITQREHRFFKNYLSRSWAFEIDTAQKRVGLAVDVDLLELPADYYSGYLSQLAAVTREQACEAVRLRLPPTDLVVVVVGTAETTYEAIRTRIPQLEHAEIVPFDAD